MNEFNERRPILILGIGNILLRDEGVGVRVIETLQQQKTPDTIDLVDGGTSGADLIDILADRRKVIIVDAVDAGKAPGTVIRFEEDDLENIPNSALSLHELGIAQNFEDKPARGEYTIVIEGLIEDKQAWDEEELLIQIKNGIKENTPPSALAKELSKSSGWPRRKIYDLIQEKNKSQKE